MKAVIVNMDQKEQDKATQPLSVSTRLHCCSNMYQDCRLHYQKQSIHFDMDKLSIHWRLKN